MSELGPSFKMDNVQLKMQQLVSYIKDGSFQTQLIVSLLFHYLMSHSRPGEFYLPAKAGGQNKADIYGIYNKCGFWMTICSCP